MINNGTSQYADAYFEISYIKAFTTTGSVLSANGTSTNSSSGSSSPSGSGSGSGSGSSPSGSGSSNAARGMGAGVGVGVGVGSDVGALVVLPVQVFMAALALVVGTVLTRL